MRRREYLVGGLLLSCGTLVLTVSVIYESSILAFIGLGFTFWGAIFLFIRPERHVKSVLLDSTVTPTLETLSKIVAELDYKGKAVYLPPKYLTNPKSGLVYITKKKGAKNPPAEEISEQKIFAKNPLGIQINPPGLALTNLFEKEIETSFVTLDLKDLQNVLPKLFIEELEIAQDLEISVEDDIIQLILTGSAYKDVCKEARKLSNICNLIGGPLCSSIACMLTRVTGKPIVIENNECSKDCKTVKVRYRILEE